MIEAEKLKILENIYLFLTLGESPERGLLQAEPAQPHEPAGHHLHLWCGHILPGKDSFNQRVFSLIKCGSESEVLCPNLLISLALVRFWINNADPDSWAQQQLQHQQSFEM